MDKTAELIMLLIQHNLITTSALAELKKQPGFNSNPEEAIINKGLVDVEELTRLKANLYGLNYRSLLEAIIPDQAINSIPAEVAENYKIICFEIDQRKMKVGIVDPENYQAFEAIDFLTKEQDLRPEYFLISALSFNNAFKHYKTLGKEISGALKT